MTFSMVGPSTTPAASSPSTSGKLKRDPKWAIALAKKISTAMNSRHCSDASIDTPINFGCDSPSEPPW